MKEKNVKKGMLRIFILSSVFFILLKKYNLSRYNFIIVLQRSNDFSVY